MWLCPMFSHQCAHTCTVAALDAFDSLLSRDFDTLSLHVASKSMHSTKLLVKSYKLLWRNVRTGTHHSAYACTVWTTSLHVQKHSAQLRPTIDCTQCLFDSCKAVAHLVPFMHDRAQVDDSDAVTALATIRGSS